MTAERAVETAAVPNEGAELLQFRPMAQGLRRPRVTIEERLARAGLAIATDVVGAYEGSDARTDNPLAVHAPTVVAILATLAAECAQHWVVINQRAALRTSAGGWVMGGPADALIFRRAGQQIGPMRSLWDIIAAAARAAGATSTELPDLDAIVAMAEAHVGEKPYPVLSVSRAHRPKALLRQAAARHRSEMMALAAAEGLATPAEQALACATAIASVIHHEVEPATLARVAAEVMIGSARLTPLPFAVG